MLYYLLSIVLSIFGLSSAAAAQQRRKNGEKYAFRASSCRAWGAFLVAFGCFGLNFGFFSHFQVISVLIFAAFGVGIIAIALSFYYSMLDASKRKREAENIDYAKSIEALEQVWPPPPRSIKPE